MTAPAPSWAQIAILLSFLFRKAPLDLKSLNSRTRRLDYEDLETIIYHLFLHIDEKETKRRFKLVYPARSSEKQHEFLMTSLQLINNHKISRHITLAQLRAGGGDPVRRLLHCLIRRVVDIKLSKMRGPKVKITPEDLESKFASLRTEISVCENKINKVNSLRDSVGKARSRNQEMAKLVQSRGFSLAGIDGESGKDVLDSCFEELSSRIAVATTRYREVSDTLRNLGILELSGANAMKQGEFGNHLTNGGEIIEKLKVLDEKRDSLALVWAARHEKFLDDVLKIPSIKERYQFFENIIPPVDIRPIGTSLDRNRMM